MSRKSDNLEILNQLSEFLAKYPDQRFGQALVNLDVLTTERTCDGSDIAIKDPFYEEPVDMLERIKKQRMKMNF